MDLSAHWGSHVTRWKTQSLRWGVAWRLSSWITPSTSVHLSAPSSSRTWTQHLASSAAFEVICPVLGNPSSSLFPWRRHVCARLFPPSQQSEVLKPHGKCRFHHRAFLVWMNWIFTFLLQAKSFSLIRARTYNIFRSVLVSFNFLDFQESFTVRFGEGSHEKKQGEEFLCRQTSV